jgi:hypothetical protein
MPDRTAFEVALDPWVEAVEHRCSRLWYQHSLKCRRVWTLVVLVCALVGLSLLRPPLAPPSGDDITPPSANQDLAAFNKLVAAVTLIAVVPTIRCATPLSTGGIDAVWGSFCRISQPLTAVGIRDVAGVETASQTYHACNQIPLGSFCFLLNHRTTHL